MGLLVRGGVLTVMQVGVGLLLVLVQDGGGRCVFAVWSCNDLVISMISTTVSSLSGMRLRTWVRTAIEM